MQHNEYINHEVRIQLLENICTKIDDRFQHLENKIDSHFRWTIGTILAMVLSIVTMFGGVMLTNYTSAKPKPQEIVRINK